VLLLLLRLVTWRVAGWVVVVWCVKVSCCWAVIGRWCDVVGGKKFERVDRLRGVGRCGGCWLVVELFRG
jgi:hypothetical protein